MHFLLAHEFRTIEVVGSLEANKGTHCIRRVGLVLVVARLMGTDSLWQTRAQRAAMGVAFRGWLEHFAAGLVY